MLCDVAHIIQYGTAWVTVINKQATPTASHLLWCGERERKWTNLILLTKFQVEIELGLNNNNPLFIEYRKPIHSTDQNSLINFNAHQIPRFSQCLHAHRCTIIDADQVIFNCRCQSVMAAWTADAVHVYQTLRMQQTTGIFFDEVGKSLAHVEPSMAKLIGTDGSTWPKLGPKTGNTLDSPWNLRNSSKLCQLLESPLHTPPPPTHTLMKQKVIDDSSFAHVFDTYSASVPSHTCAMQYEALLRSRAITYNTQRQHQHLSTVWHAVLFYGPLWYWLTYLKTAQ